MSRLACVVVAVFLTVIALAPAPAEAQTYGSTCRVNRAHRYSFTTPATRWADVSSTLYYNQQRAAFLMLVFDDDGDVVVSSASGGRFVRFNASLLPGERYEVWIGCVVASAAFRFDLLLSDAQTLTSHGTVNTFAPEHSAAEQSRLFGMEAEFQRRLAKFYQ